MNKVIGHYQAVCPYCQGILKYQLYDDGKKRMLNQCKHFYCFRGEYEVCFCTTKDVKAEVEMAECEFSLGGWCFALACYSKTQCGARDEDGNPRYVSNKKLGISEIIKEKKMKACNKCEHLFTIERYLSNYRRACGHEDIGREIGWFNLNEPIPIPDWCPKEDENVH